MNSGTPDLPFPLLRRCLLLHRAGELLGKLAEQAGLQELARLGYQVAVAARPDLGSGHLALARVLVDAEASVEAVPHLETCLATDPLQTEAWLLYAWALVRLGQIEPAHGFVQERLILLTVLAPSEGGTTPAEKPTGLAKLREDLVQLSDLLQASAAERVGSRQ